MQTQQRRCSFEKQRFLAARENRAIFFAHREHHPYTPSLPYRISEAVSRYFSTLYPPATPPKLKFGTLKANPPTHSAPKFQLDPSRFGTFRIKTSFLMFFLRKMHQNFANFDRAKKGEKRRNLEFFLRDRLVFNPISPTVATKTKKSNKFCEKSSPQSRKIRKNRIFHKKNYFFFSPNFDVFR